jgi:hypothetical protein
MGVLVFQDAHKSFLGVTLGLGVFVLNLYVSTAKWRQVEAKGNNGTELLIHGSRKL